MRLLNVMMPLTADLMPALPHSFQFSRPRACTGPRIPNPTEETLDYGLVEFWDPNLHQVALELLTSDLLQAGITDGIERRRRALATRFTHEAIVGPGAPSRRPGDDGDRAAGKRAARARRSSTGFRSRSILAVLDDGVDAGSRLAGRRRAVARPRPHAAARRRRPGRRRTRRARATLDGAGQPAVLALRVPLRLGPASRATRRFAFGMVPGGGTPDAALAELRARAATLAADTDRSWRDRLVWAAFPGLPRAAVDAARAGVEHVCRDREHVVRRVPRRPRARPGRRVSLHPRPRRRHGRSGALRRIDAAGRSRASRATRSRMPSPRSSPARSRRRGASPTPPPASARSATSASTTQRSDAYWFLPSIVGKYVGLTRDAGFLDTPVPYWPRAAGEIGHASSTTSRAVSTTRSTSAPSGIGARGLVAIGTNDYADGVLNLTTERPVTPGGSSSTYNAGMIVYGLPLAADLARVARPRARDAHAGPGGVADERAARPGVGRTLLLARLRGQREPRWRRSCCSRSRRCSPCWPASSAPDRRDLALGEVTRRLETSTGALSTVAIGTVGPIGGIDQPLVGGIWPVANAWLTAAYARRDPQEAWSSFMRNTLAAHAELLPGALVRHLDRPRLVQRARQSASRRSRRAHRHRAHRLPGAERPRAHRARCARSPTWSG